MEDEEEEDDRRKGRNIEVAGWGGNGRRSPDGGIIISMGTPLQSFQHKR